MSTSTVRTNADPRIPTDEGEIRTTAKGRLQNYLAYASRLFDEMKRDTITIKAIGYAIPLAVSLAEELKLNFKGLHQITKCEAGPVSDICSISSSSKSNNVSMRNSVEYVEILLSKTPLDTTNIGYQAPLNTADDTEVDASREVALRNRWRPPRRGSMRGRARGRYGSRSFQSRRGGAAAADLNQSSTTISNAATINTGNQATNGVIGELDQTEIKENKADNRQPSVNANFKMTSEPNDMGGTTSPHKTTAPITKSDQIIFNNSISSNAKATKPEVMDKIMWSQMQPAGQMPANTDRRTRGRRRNRGANINRKEMIENTGVVA